MVSSTGLSKGASSFASHPPEGVCSGQGSLPVHSNCPAWADTRGAPHSAGDQSLRIGHSLKELAPETDF